MSDILAILDGLRGTMRERHEALECLRCHALGDDRRQFTDRQAAILFVELCGPLGQISAERQRQIEREGYDNVHDDQHPGGDIALAAAAYALEAAIKQNPNQESYGSEPPDCWPWDHVDWKPKTVREDLVRAGALIVAELERLDRAAKGKA